jgi:aminoglycoside 6'-N-acetyltransferase
MTDAIAFRPLNRNHFPLLQHWLAQPHVARWWNHSSDLASIENKYGARIDGIEPVHVFLIEHDDRFVGFIQWYRWSDYSEHALLLEAGPETTGIDLAIGEPEMLGSGLGPRAIKAFIEQVIFADHNIKAVVTDVSADNSRSLRAFEKAGFSKVKTVQLPGEDFQRWVMRL